MSVPAVKRTILFSLGLLLLLATVLSLALGPVSIPFTDAIGALLRPVTGWSVAADTQLIVERGRHLVEGVGVERESVHGDRREWRRAPPVAKMEPQTVDGRFAVVGLDLCWHRPLPPSRSLPARRR